MTRYRVGVSEAAEQDLIDIYRYVAIHDSVEKAAYVLEQLETPCSSLAERPMRDLIPPELNRVGVTNYREVHCKPYRVIYEVIGQDAFVNCVLDGRRDMQSLLERRLVR